MIKSVRAFAILCLLVLPSAVQAQDSYGLAMHGKAKYAADAKHLEYVNPQAPKGGGIKIAGIGTFDTVNPYSIKGVAAEGLPLVYDRLMQRVWDEPFALYPLVAEKADVAPDRSWISFTLNPKAQFHDGSKVTPHDVIYSYETLKEHGRPNMRRIYRLVEKAEITGDGQIRFTLGKGYDRETVMILAMMPVLSKAWWSKHTFDATLITPPLVNGPYRIVKVDPGRKIVYERVKDYWAKDLLVNVGQYNFDQITYEYFRDDTIALESLQKGDLDLRREWDIGKWEKSYTNLDLKTYEKLEIPHQRPERMHGLIFNMRRPPFNDARVRKALFLAFDQEWIGKNQYHDKFKRIESFFPNAVLDGSGALSPATLSVLEEFKTDVPSTVFNETLKINDTRPLRERMREADDLLKQAGWVVEDGRRLNKDTKKPFSFEILFLSPQEQKIALTFQRSLERLGIDMKMRMLDSATFQDRKTAYDYDMLIFYWQNTLSPGTEQALYWSCDSVKIEAQFNYAGICKSSLDAIIKRIPDAKSYDELTSYAQSIDRILLSEYTAIPLFYKGSDYVVASRKIHRPETVPLYGFVMETLWVEPLQ